MDHFHPNWQNSILETKERLRSDSIWFPYPALISFGLVILFLGHILLGINPRLGNPASPMVFNAEPGRDNSIWLSLSPHKDHLYITTSDRQVFKVPLENPGIESFAEFNQYLDSQLKNILISAGLAQRITASQSSLVLSVDQTLNYAHIRPVLFALAKSGISTYGFETKLPLDDSNSKQF